MHKIGRRSGQKNSTFNGRVMQTSDSTANVRVFKPKLDRMEEILLPGRHSSVVHEMQTTPEIAVVPSVVRKTSRPEKPLIDQRIMMTNKACYVIPDQNDFGQLTTNNTDMSIGVDQYQNLLLEQYGFDPIVPEELKELKKALGANVVAKVENSSQYANPDRTFTETDGSPWHYVDTVEDIEQYLKKEGKPCPNYTPKNIRIAETPRVKVVTEKYFKIKKNNIELRKLEEKIVCVEYDVYDNELSVFTQPVQVMRAFFAIKTGCELCNGEKVLASIPTPLRDRLQIDEEEIKLLAEKEIEIIDEKVPDNKPYLDDLKRVLKKKRIITQKKKQSTLDLHYMYEMAKKDTAPLDHDFSSTNLLSQAELQEMKDLILQQCDVTGYGVSRRTMKAKPSTHSDSVYHQLLGSDK